MHSCNHHSLRCVAQFSSESALRCYPLSTFSLFPLIKMPFNGCICISTPNHEMLFYRGACFFTDNYIYFSLKFRYNKLYSPSVIILHKLTLIKSDIISARVNDHNPDYRQLRKSFDPQATLLSLIYILIPANLALLTPLHSSLCFSRSAAWSPETVLRGVPVLSFLPSNVRAHTSPRLWEVACSSVTSALGIQSSIFTWSKLQKLSTCLMYANKWALMNTRRFSSASIWDPCKSCVSGSQGSNAGKTWVTTSINESEKYRREVFRRWGENSRMNAAAMEIERV